MCPAKYVSERKGLVPLLLVLSILVGACGPTPTGTPPPTDTPQSTATPPPSATPLPTPTPTPTPVPLAEWVAEGNALLRHSDFAGAEAAYQRAIEVDPEYHPAYSALSRLYAWQVGREDDALAQGEQAVALAPDSATAQAALTLAHVAQLDPAAAVAAAERAVALDSESANSQVALARAYSLDRQQKEALEAAERAMALDPELAEAHYALHECYRHGADFSRARMALEQATTLEPAFAPWQAGLGWWWYAAEDYDRAETAFQRALELDPNSVEALEGLAYTAMARWEFEKAGTQIERVLELIPDAPQGYVARGFLHLDQDEPDEARAQFRQALDKRADYWPAQRGIGLARMKEGECNSMARQAEELMALQPRFAEGRIQMGYARLCSGDAAKALEHFRKALELEPHNAWASNGLGHAYAAQERWEEATAAQVEALRISAADAWIHNDLGWDLTWQGEADKAEAEYQIALDLDPDSVDAHVQMGFRQLAEDRDAEARAHAEQVLALDEDHAEALRLLGIALINLGETEEGVAVLQQLIEKEPEDIFAHFHLGRVYRVLARYPEARKELETYLALNPSDPEAQRIQYMIEALEQGFLMTEDKALADLEDTLQPLVGDGVECAVEETEGEGRTLVITVPADPENEQPQEVTRMGVALGLAIMPALRIDPAVENGILVRLEKKNKPLYTLSIGLQEAEEWWVGIIPDAELDAHLQFSRTIRGRGRASVNEIKTKLSETRELEAQAKVPYHALTPDDMDAYLTSSMDAEAREAMRTSDSLLTLLGVIEPEVDLESLMMDLYAEQVVGFYDAEQEAFYVEEEEEQSATDQMVIAHEYTHALQDQHFGLELPDDEAPDDDQRRAFDALIEGDATLAMVLYASEHIGVLDLLQAMSGAGGLEGSALEASPAFVRELELFPYEEGLTFVAALHDSGGWAAVDEAYDNPPQSTEQILHPERYRAGDAPRVVALPDLAAGLGGDWQELEREVLGELGLRLALAEHVGPATAALAAEGWAGDRYTLLQQGGEGPHLLVIQTAWDDGNEAKEFWSLYAVVMDHREGYEEEVRQLTGQVRSRWWQSKEEVTFAMHQDDQVSVIIGPDVATVEQVVALLPGGAAALAATPAALTSTPISPTDTPSVTPTPTGTATPPPSPAPAATLPAIPEAAAVPHDTLRQVGQVVEVTDGDTIVVRIDGQDYPVRYIGIDAPELDQYLGPKAASKNVDLVAGKTVTLVKDVSEADQDGRLLRYVFVGDVFVNHELVRRGLARAVAYPPDTASHDAFLAIEEEARQNERNLWKPTPAPSPSPPPAAAPTHTTQVIATPTLKLTPAAKPTEALLPLSFACCPVPQPDQGLLWFDNHVGEVVRADLGKGQDTTYHEIPAKEGDVAGCLCLPLDPGLWTVILKTQSHKGVFEVDIVAGRIVRFPVSYVDH